MRESETLSHQTNVASQFSAGGVDHSFAGGIELIREQGRTLRDWTGLADALLYDMDAQADTWRGVLTGLASLVREQRGR